MLRTNLVGAALGASAVLAQSLNTAASFEGAAFLIGKLIVGAFLGAGIARAVMARFNAPG